MSLSLSFRFLVSFRPASLASPLVVGHLICHCCFFSFRFVLFQPHPLKVGSCLYFDFRFHRCFVRLSFFFRLSFSLELVAPRSCCCLDRTLGGWALSLLLFSLELVFPRFVLGDGCPKVVVFPGVLSPKGSWGGIDDAARASGCRKAI